MPAELRELMQRYNQLGVLLPRDEATLQDPRRRAEVRLVLREMAQVKEQVDKFLLQHGRRKASPRSPAPVVRPREADP